MCKLSGQSQFYYKFILDVFVGENRAVHLMSTGFFKHKLLNKLKLNSKSKSVLVKRFSANLKFIFVHR